ncbi:hypothetical protein, partial [Brachyspira pilosicoli]|uniref:hypothetical protein n=1 Tax=Brachyspira pilosicoli TaxID=52584 RepID=UPI001CA5CF9C
VPAKDGEVFGSFRRKLKYKDKWYIPAYYMYNYDPKSKTLNETDRFVVLEIDNNANINIYVKNNYDVYDKIINISVIESDRVIYEPSSYGECFVSNISVDYGYFIYSLLYNDTYYTSSDLINWQRQGNSNNIVYKMPTPNPNNPNESFQGKFGMNVSQVLYFKDYIYLMGLEETFMEQNPSGTRPPNAPSYTVSKGYYYRIHKSKDTSVGANWEKLNTPWGERSLLVVSYDKNKIYVTRGRRYYYEYDSSYNRWSIEYESFEDDKRIWSTTDGVNWSLEANLDTYNKAEIIWNGVQRFMQLPIQKRIHTPKEPNWVKLNDGIYYKSDNAYSYKIFKGKEYYVPEPPYAEIDAAYKRGEEYFTVSETHLKGAGKNQFFAAREKPNETDSWKLITPIDYTDNLMVWQSGGENVMFNINNKVIQLVDYRHIEIMVKSPPIQSYLDVINDIRRTAKMYRDGTHPYGKDILQAMYNDARADMMEAFMKNYKEYIMPDEAITHYTVEFKY